MMSFSDDMEKWLEKTEKRVEAVIKNSIEDLVEEANKPVSLGGRMPVDTGFLRQSGASAINNIPVGEAKKEKDKHYSYKPGLTALIKFNLGDTFYYGWCAEYAEVQDIRYGFKDSAVQKWPDFIKKNIGELRND